jgi:hypothetical protein
MYRNNIYAKMTGNNETELAKIAIFRININVQLQNERKKIQSPLLIITTADTATHK